MANLQTETFNARAESYGPDGIMDLRKGYCGGIVVQMQCLLRFLGYEVESTGEYDDATAFGVTNFQKDAGLPLTGIIDYDTRMALKDMYLANKKAADAELGADNARAANRGNLRREIRADLAKGSTATAEAFLSEAVNDPEKFDTDFGISESILVELYSLVTGRHSNKNEGAHEKLEKEGFGEGGLPKPTAVPQEDFQKEVISFLINLLSDARLLEFLNAASERAVFIPIVMKPDRWDVPFVAEAVLLAQQIAEERKRSAPPEQGEAPPQEGAPSTPSPEQPAPAVPVVSSTGNVLVFGGLALLVVYALFRTRVDRDKSIPPTLQGYTSPFPPEEEEEEEEDEE